MSDQGLREAIDEAFAAGEPSEDSVEATSEEALEESAAPEGSEDNEVEETTEEEPQAVDEQEEEQEDGQDGQAADFDWSAVPQEAWGALERLPRDAVPVGYLRVKQDRDRFASEADVYRRQLAEYQQKMQQPGEKPPENEQSAPSEPRRPGPDATEEEWVSYAEARDKWLVDKVRYETVNELQKTWQQREEQARAEAAEKQRAEHERELLDYVNSKDGMTDDIAHVMAHLAQSKAYYRQMLSDKDGIDELFGRARTIVDSQRERAQQTTRKATARDRVTPRSKPAPKKVSEDIDIPDDPTDIGGRMNAILDAGLRG